MNLLLFGLAELAEDLDNLVPKPRYTLGPSTRNYLIVFGAVCVVTVLAVVWAVYLRKRRRRRSGHHGYHHSSESQRGRITSSRQDQSEPVTGTRRRWRRRRRPHRPRNPTLAETGGLPPVREERPPEPFP
jgi:hypothetical protein